MSFPFFGVFKRFGGTFSGFGAGGQELFWKQTPKKGGFFHSIAGFGVVFWVISITAQGQLKRLEKNDIIR